MPVRHLVFLIVFAGFGRAGLAQTAPAAVPAAAPLVAADSTHKYQASEPGRPWWRGKLVRATAVPALLIGYGASTINGHGLYSSYQARRDIHRLVGPGRHTRIDDHLQFAPYLELGVVLLAGVESRNDRLNLALVIAKGEVLMLASVYSLKALTRITRPDGSAANAFPSGHTAQAFLAASIVHTELRDRSQWYGVGAYAIASSVGILRMVNDRHWQSDIVAGAGVGILSAHLAYLSHRHRWGRRPALTGGSTGSSTGGSTGGSTFGVAPHYYAGTVGLRVQWHWQ